MKSSTLLSLSSFVSLALAGSSMFRKRDLATIQNALNAINTAAGTLDTNVKAFDGSAGAVTTLESDSAAVLDAINTGNSEIAPTDPISDNDALAVAGTTNTLITTLNQTIDDLIAQRQAFDSAGVSSTVLDQLQQQSIAADTFGATVVSKIPSDLQGIAQSLTAQITAAFQRGIAAYQDANASPTTSTVSPTSSSSSSESLTSETSTPISTPISTPTTSSSTPGTTAPTSEPSTTSESPTTSENPTTCEAPTTASPTPTSTPGESCPGSPPTSSNAPPPESYPAPSQSHAPSGPPSYPHPSQPAGGNPWGDIGKCIAQCIAAQHW
ncbi:MAG: hypothetical protein M1820_003287 [Bogoriella megaspora]|nr:MAG: hypothetical protein M1820_003287 [Bogoriella megaspora]